MSLLPKRLKELRERFDITQEVLSELSGISQKHVSRLERGESDATGDMLIKITAVFGVSSDYLLGLSDDGTSNLFPKEKQAVEAWRKGDRMAAIKVIVEDE